MAPRYPSKTRDQNVLPQVQSASQRSHQYFSYAYSDLFQYQSRLKTIAKGFGVYITTQLLFVLITSIVVILLVVFDKEVYEMVKPSNNR